MFGTTIDLSRPRPRFSAVDPAAYDTDSLPFRRIRKRREELEEELHAVRADVTYRLAGDLPGFVKAGGKLTARKKTRDNRQSQTEPVAPIPTLGSLPGIALPPPRDYYDGDYRFGPAIDYDAFIDFLVANPARFRLPRRATARLATGTAALIYDISVFNIDFTGTQTADTFDNLTAAHFHAGANPAALTQPVMFGFIGMPFNETMPNDAVVTPFASGVDGRVTGRWDAPEGNNNTTLTTQLPNILAGRAYLNFHTVQFPGGEVCGNIAAVPEPATWASMIVGFAIVGAAMRRSKCKFRRAARLA